MLDTAVQPGGQRSWEGAISASFKDPISHLLRTDPSKFIIPHTRKLWIERAEILRRRQIRQAREDASAFMEYCFYDEKTGLPFEQQWFHDEWHAAWDEFQRVMIIAPRDHAKTSNVVGRAIWELGRDPNLRIKIVCATDARAKERLFEIALNIDKNPRVREVFPNLKAEEDAPWNAHKIIVQRTARHRDASVEALGITSTATGGRADLLIADDVVDRRNALSFPALKEQIKQAWKSDWTNLLEPDSRVWYICTLWSPTDLSHELMDNKAYTVLRYDIDGRFGSIWPGKWPEIALRLRYDEIGSIEFNRAFRNQAIDLESTLISPDWFVFRDLSEDDEFLDRVNEMTFLTSYDSAGSPTGNKNQDYSASAPIAIDIDRSKIYIMDAWHARKSIKRVAEMVWTEYEKYDPFRILIEKVGQATLDEWVLNDHPELDGIVEVTKPRVNKFQRLMGTTPLLEKGQIIFNSHLDPHRPEWSPARGNIYDELVDFPFGKHDDMADAYSQAVNKAREYFLDWDATGGENVVNINVGRRGSDEGPKYLF